MRTAILILIILFTSGCVHMESTKPTSEQVTVESLVNEIQIAIDKINANTELSRLPKFTKAEVTLNTKKATEGKLEGKLVVSAGGQISQEETTTMTMTLKSKEISSEKATGSPGTRLADQVLLAVKATQDNDQLVLQKLEVETDIVLTKTGEGGFEIDVVGIGVEGKVSRTNEHGNTLKLIFENKEK